MDNTHKTLVIKGGGRSWKAYFASDPETVGVGRSENEAAASIYLHSIGKLILEDPDSFGLRIQKEGS
jgi:hypothetical protein